MAEASGKGRASAGSLGDAVFATWAGLVAAGVAGGGEGFATTAGAVVVAALAVATGLGSVSESRGGEDCFCGSPTLASTSARSEAVDAA